MGILMEEYGLLVIACVVGAFVMGLVHAFFYGNNMSMVKIYSSEVPDMEIYATDNTHYDRTYEYSPHFVAVNDSTQYDMKDRIAFTKTDALKLVNIYVDDAETTKFKGGSYYDDVTINVTRYDLVMTYWMHYENKFGSTTEKEWVPYDGAPSADIISMDKAQRKANGWVQLDNPTPCYEYVDVLDKYGNRVWMADASGKYILDASGNRIAKQQRTLKYYTDNTNPKYYWELGDAVGYDASGNIVAGPHRIDITVQDMEDNENMAPRYKLVYRVQQGTKKAEYTTLIIKSGAFDASAALSFP